MAGALVVVVVWGSSVEDFTRALVGGAVFKVLVTGTLGVVSVRAVI